MTQREFQFERASVEAHLARIELSAGERRLLTGLVRFYFACRDRNDGRGIRCEDGRVLVEPSKEDLAAVLRCSVPTIKRLLRETRDTAAYVLIETATHRTHCYTIDFPGLYAAPTTTDAAVPVSDDPPRSAPKQGDQTGGSRLPQRGITAPQKGDHDPGSGGSNGGIMTRDQTGGSRGGKGGFHSIFRFNEMNSMESMEGNGILEICRTAKPASAKSGSRGANASWWWGRELSDADFRQPERMQELYERACELGLVNGSEQDRVCWFALLVHYGRRKKLRNRSAVLTANMRRGTDGLGRPWRTIPAAEDEDTARQLIKQVDYPPLDDWDGDDSDCFALPEEPVTAPGPLAAVAAVPPAVAAPTLSGELAEQLRRTQQAARERAKLQIEAEGKGTR